MNDRMNTILKKKEHRGQNFIEYLILVVGVVLVLFYVMNPKSGPMKNAIENVFNGTIKGITVLNSEIKYN